MSSLLLIVLGGGAALARPAPLDDGPGQAPAGGGSVPILDDGFDWAPWLWTAAVVLIVVAVVGLIASTTIRHRHHPAHV